MCLGFFCRDDLYRVELDNMAGDEMFYSKVRTDTEESRTSNNLRFQQCIFFQKRTWESNKNDIRVCRMKGKHEVWRPQSVFVITFMKAGKTILPLKYCLRQCCSYVIEARRNTWWPRSSQSGSCHLSPDVFVLKPVKRIPPKKLKQWWSDGSECSEIWK